MARDLSQRYRGQKEAGSCTACTLARLGAAATAAVLALSCLAPSAAQAAKHASAGDPSPQPSPVSSGSTPSPDPAPQAVTRSTPSHAAAPSTPAIRRTTPAVSTVATPPVSPARTFSAQPPSSVVRSPSPGRVRHRHVPGARHASARVGPLSFPLALPRALLLFPRAGAPVHRNGVLLLLSSVAMAVVAVASFTLLRRLRRLEAA